MGGVVAEKLQRLGALVGDDLERRVPIDQIGEIALLAVHLRRERRLGEARTDVARDLGHRHGIVVTAHRAVRQTDGDGGGGLAHAHE